MRVRKNEVDRVRCLRVVAALPLLAGLALPATAADNEEIGRVAAIEGVVHAQAPGERLRRLDCEDPVFEGDRILTDENAGVGVLSRDFYTRLSQSTEAELRVAASGAPALDLSRGHLRLIDENEQRAEGRIGTPGLTAAEAGRDTEAFAFPEKAWVVSMICGYEDPVDVARRADPSETAAGALRQCAVEKPREPIYQARAADERLPVMARDRCGALPRIAAVDRFATPPVALAPPVAAAGPLAGSATPPGAAPCGGVGGAGCVVLPGAGGGGGGAVGRPIVPVVTRPRPVPAPIP